MGSFWPKPIRNPLYLLSSRASVGSANDFNNLYLAISAAIDFWEVFGE